MQSSWRRISIHAMKIDDQRHDQTLKIQWILLNEFCMNSHLRKTIWGSFIEFWRRNTSNWEQHDSVVPIGYIPNPRFRKRSGELNIILDNEKKKKKVIYIRTSEIAFHQLDKQEKMKCSIVLEDLKICFRRTDYVWMDYILSNYDYDHSKIQTRNKANLIISQGASWISRCSLAIMTSFQQDAECRDKGKQKSKSMNLTMTKWRPMIFVSYKLLIIRKILRKTLTIPITKEMSERNKMVFIRHLTSDTNQKSKSSRIFPRELTGRHSKCKHLETEEKKRFHDDRHTWTDQKKSFKTFTSQFINGVQRTSKISQKKLGITDNLIKWGLK